VDIQYFKDKKQENKTGDPGYLAYGIDMLQPESSAVNIDPKKTAFTRKDLLKEEYGIQLLEERGLENVEDESKDQNKKGDETKNNETRNKIFIASKNKVEVLPRDIDDNSDEY